MNPHGPFGPLDFKSNASANFAIPPLSTILRYRRSQSTATSHRTLSVRLPAPGRALHPRPQRRRTQRRYSPVPFCLIVAAALVAVTYCSVDSRAIPAGCTVLRFQQ